MDTELIKENINLYIDFPVVLIIYKFVNVYAILI